jgi:membrane fusion protein, multidrug efflux system
MIQNIVLSVFIVLLTFGGLAAVKVAQIQKLMAMPRTPPPETVSWAVALETNWQQTVSAVGSITSVQGVNVTPETPGTVVEIAFESGATVAKGDLLLRQDTSSEKAQLSAIEAQVQLARLNAERERNLRKENMISQAELDAAEATLKQNQANADNVRATIEKKTIRAPFAGRLGIRLVNVGQYLEAGKPIVSLQCLSPIYAEFSLPQQELARIKTGMEVRVKTDAYPTNAFKGVLTAINPDLDPTMRSVSLQATLENPGELLRPGMYARMEVVLPEKDGSSKVLAIPATAVLSAPYGDSVFVIEPAPATTNSVAQAGTPNSAPGLIVRQQFIRTGRMLGDLLSVESGLKPGDKVVSAGVFKLRNNASVIENNTIAPDASTTPNPSDS